MQALEKAKQYCAYQERCHQEVREKLFGHGLNTKEVGQCIAHLIEENFLNEERFAIAYAGGKFRVKHWGKNKIRFSLKQKQVSDYCIKKALAAIDLDDYEKTLVEIAHKKLKEIKTGALWMRQQKVKQYLLQRGFESHYFADLFKD
jgi:regulatory protein